jgi:uncharacterized membrane protein
LIERKRAITQIKDRGGGYGVECHFQQYLNYIVAVNFIGGGNQSTWKKPLTNLYHLMLYRVPIAMNGIQTQNFSGYRH